jgi:hypothetical protein
METSGQPDLGSQLEQMILRLTSGAALSTVVRMLVEEPVMLSIVQSRSLRHTCGRFGRAAVRTDLQRTSAAVPLLRHTKCDESAIKYMMQ